MRRIVPRARVIITTAAAAAHLVTVFAVIVTASGRRQEFVVEHVLVGIRVRRLLGIAVTSVEVTTVLTIVTKEATTADLHDFLKLVVALLIAGTAF